MEQEQAVVVMVMVIASGARNVDIWTWVPVCMRVGVCRAIPWLRLLAEAIR